MIHSLAGELGLDVYVISLSRTGLDDSALSELTSELPERCIALMEDIDAAFQGLENRKFGGSFRCTLPASPPHLRLGRVKLNLQLNLLAAGMVVPDRRR